MPFMAGVSMLAVGFHDASGDWQLHGVVRCGVITEC